MQHLKDYYNGMKSVLFFVLIFSIALFETNCGPSPSTTCNTTNTFFNQLYASVAALPGHIDTVHFDTEIHAYRFKFSQTKTICSIGYQSLPAVASVPYKMEILDTFNTILYSGNHVFSSANTSYVTIPPVLIVANQTYTIRRTILLTSAGNVFANITGRAVRQNGALIAFPVTFGIMTITGSNFYQNGGPLINAGIPYIDFGYY